MTNLKNYSDNELSLQVYNDELLYRLRKDIDFLMAFIDETFHYTEAQRKILIDDLNNEEK